MFMTSSQIAGLLYDQEEQESISEAFTPVVGMFYLSKGVALCVNWWSFSNTLISKEFPDTIIFFQVLITD